MPAWPDEWQQYRAGRAWGLTPRAWRAESMDDRAIMLAIFLFENTIEARRAEHRNKLLDREMGRDTGSDRSANDFRRLKDRLRNPEQFAL
jgi:hypothetical protein